MMTDQFSKIKRKYFEAFGDLEEEIRFLRRLSFIFSAVVLALLVSLFFVSKKPPVVIRVSEVKGAEVINDLKQNNAPITYEMIGFAKRFTLRYTGYNSYTVTRDLSESFNMMTERFQKEAQKKIVDSGLLTKAKESGIDTQIEFKEEKLERDSDDVAVISLIGVREIKKYGVNNFNQRSLFRSDLVLKKVNRSRNVPEGLLVEEYREILMNELPERKP
jgi:hypothetical protein